MPSSNTITAFYEFTAGTKARSSEVNSNFSVYRGNLLPVNTDTASSSDLTHNLGSDTHRWNDIYGGGINLAGATSTTDFRLVPSTSDTLGVVDLMFGTTTITTLNPDGFDGNKIRPRQQTSTASMGVLYRKDFGSNATTNGTYVVVDGTITVYGGGLLRVEFSNSPTGIIPGDSGIYCALSSSSATYVVANMLFGATSTSMSTMSSMKFILHEWETYRVWEHTGLRFNIFDLSAGTHFFQFELKSDGAAQVGFRGSTNTSSIVMHEI